MPTAGPLSDQAREWAPEMAAVANHADREGFLRIYDHFMPRLCLYLRGMGAGQAVAEDMAQEAMLRLWQQARAYDPARSALSTWLFRIARNLHIDRVRRESFGLTAAAEFPLELAMENTATAEDHAEGEQLRRRIDALPPVQARLIRMSYFEAKSHQEIASELGMPLGTVKSHLRRALLHLQGEMGETP